VMMTQVQNLEGTLPAIMLLSNHFKVWVVLMQQHWFSSWVILGAKFRSWAKLGGLEFWLGELFTWSGLRDLQIYSPKFIFKKLYIKPLAHGYL
jgi:hypothetical protein